MLDSCLHGMLEEVARECCLALLTKDCREAALVHYSSDAQVEVQGEEGIRL
jgi:hypothetical protein